MQKVYNENEKEFMLPNWFRNLFKLQWNPEPDFAIEQDGKPYLVRWWIIPRNRFFNIWLHEIHQSDTDVGLHDHPWNNMTFVLKGGYEEVTLTYPENLVSHYADQTSFYECEQTRHIRKRFNIVVRNAREPHRLVLNGPARTLFFTGPAYREWGFHCKDGWVHFATFKKNRAKASAAVDTNDTTVPNTAPSKNSVDFEI